MNSNQLDRIASSIHTAMQHNKKTEHINFAALPDRRTITTICDIALSLFFPGFFDSTPLTTDYIDTWTKQQIITLEQTLCEQVCRSTRYTMKKAGDKIDGDIQAISRERLQSFLDHLPAIAELVASDVEAAFQNDPAACSREDIIVSYPCIEAITVYRLAHQLYKMELPFIPRMMTEVAHNRTGIDIHPGATIGRSFFIDHGTGVVIGETCEIGDNCVLYHGVTLGAFNPLARNDSGDLNRGNSKKRHPTLGDKVIVYPGATILGGDTIIGARSVIGGNVWLTHSVEEKSIITNKDAELNIRTR